MSRKKELRRAVIRDPNNCPFIEKCRDIVKAKYSTARVVVKDTGKDRFKIKAILDDIDCNLSDWSATDNLAWFSAWYFIDKGIS